MLRTAYNPTESPLFVDSQGHRIDGLSWAPVDPGDAVTAALIAGDYITLLDWRDDALNVTPPAMVDPDALAAVQATATVNAPAPVEPGDATDPADAPEPDSSDSDAAPPTATPGTDDAAPDETPKPRRSHTRKTTPAAPAADTSTTGA